MKCSCGRPAKFMIRSTLPSDLRERPMCASCWCILKVKAAFLGNLGEPWVPNDRESPMSSNNRPPINSVRKVATVPVNDPVYARQPTHLHQSMLRLFEENPVEFYLQEMAPEGTVPDHQSMPAAVGCAFDAHVKSLIARLLFLPCPTLKQLLVENVTLEKREEAMDRGRKLLAGYVESGALTALMAENPHSVEIHVKKIHNKVPIAGTLDAAMYPKGSRPRPNLVNWVQAIWKGKPLVVHDWKTTGHNRPGEVSPHPGYLRLFDTEGPGVAVGPHGRHKEPLENIDERWATQVTVYGFLLGHKPGRHEVSIDEIIVGKEDRVRVAQYRTHVTKKFQLQVVERLKGAWKQIQERKVIPEAFTHCDLEVLKALR